VSFKSILIDATEILILKFTEPKQRNNQTNQVKQNQNTIKQKTYVCKDALIIVIKQQNNTKNNIVRPTYNVTIHLAILFIIIIKIRAIYCWFNMPVSHNRGL
jgi:hypothetical protein